MQTVQSPEPALPLRSDTILGVCEALGQDFGFHPNVLRIGLATLVLWSPPMAFGIYFALGAVVLLSRLVVPQRMVRAADATGLNSGSRFQDGSEELSLAA